jgi:prepilin peptidase CpaA
VGAGRDAAGLRRAAAAVCDPRDGRRRREADGDGRRLGARATLDALLFCVVTGGIAAIVFALRQRALGRMLANSGGLLRDLLWSVVAGGKPRLQPGAVKSVGKLPYGVSIAIGTATYVFAQQFGLV